MATPPLSPHLAQQALDAYAAHGSVSAAARALNLSRPTFQHRLDVARQYGLTPNAGKTGDSGDADTPHLLQQIKNLQAELAKAQQERLEAETIRRKIIGLTQAVEVAAPPRWTIEPRGKASSPGVPTLFLSDLHWGEVVEPSQIMHRNEYSVAIAHERMRRLVETAEHLLRIISPSMDYPGIVVPLGGDMISGNIHEELTATNELNSMPAVLDLYGVLVKVLTHFADTFGRVFVPCVTGNHGRDTHKIWNKDRHHTSFDWLLYCLLAKHFEAVGDKRVQFYIPDGPDAYYRIYGYRYLLTHGDQFRGGDGMIGALGPIIRGDHRKRSRNAQVGLDYDTMLLGHFHQYIHLGRLIVNGSLKGMDEYAYNNNFPYEPPQQALWITHPKYGITYRMPVFVDRRREAPQTEWVSIPAAR